MPLHTATPVVLAFARYFARPDCPRCGETQLAAEQSEFVQDGLIHHVWACDACGHRFTTSVEFNRDAA